MFDPAQVPSCITIPDDMHIEYPPVNTPEKIKSFFGKTGKWWGTWTSPQVKGSYDAVLVIKQIKNLEEADIAYLTSDFPKWYTEKSLWETTAKFLKKENGRTSLLIPYNPWHTHIECWFEGKVFVGVIYNRFMLSRINWKPLP
ncbi:MAG: hypothetical protein NT178_09080 [Proteobacteria bacterium]|nr:hypothetical protein [Pseudomonadota bacterium]